MRKKLLILITVICLMCCSLTAVTISFAAEADKIIKTQLQFSNVKWTDAETKDKVIYAASPFGDDLSGMMLKLTPESVISYSFYAPTPIAGMGGIDIQTYSLSTLGVSYYNNIAADFSDDGISDNNGNSAFYVDDITVALTNGWYKRSFKMPQSIFEGMAEVKIQHLFLAGAVKFSDLKIMKDSGKTSLDMYYKDFKLSDADGEKIIFDSVKGGHPFKNWLQLDYGETSIKGDAFKGSNYSFAVAGKVTLSLETDPNPLSIVLDNSERIFYAGKPIELLSLTSTPNTVVAAIFKGVELVPNEGSSFTPQEGAYVIVYQNKTPTNDAIAVYVLYAYDENLPIILNGDMDKIPQTGVAAAKTYLPTIKAYYKGEKTVDTEITVKKGGESLTVLSDDKGSYFIPTAKQSATYTITYTAQKDGETYTLSREMSVIDMDFPTADFSLWATNLEVGSNYILPEVIVSDPSDGKMKNFTLTIYDTYSNPVPIVNNSIRPLISGGYKAEVKVTDSDNNTKKYEYSFGVSPIAESVYTVRAYVPEALRRAGVQKKFVVALSRDIFRYVPVLVGDVLHYEVYSPSNIAGVGSISGQFSGTFLSKQWPMLADFYKEFKMTDTSGKSMAADADLTKELKDETGSPVWYSRDVELAPENSSKLVGGQLVHFALIIDTTAACGEYIEVSYRNAQITRGSGEVIPILPPPRPIDSNVWESVGVSKGYLVGGLDPEPMLLKQFLPSESELGKEIIISNKVVYDFNLNKLLPSTLEITDEAGEIMETTENEFGYGFTTKQAGTYTLTYSFINKGIKKQIKTQLKLKDSTPPSIKFGEYKKDYSAGDTLTIPQPECSDAVWNKDDITVKINAFYNSKAINVTDNKIDGVKKGQYMIVYTCTDKSGNASVERLYFDVSEVVKTSGCGGVAFGGGHSGAEMLAVLAAALAAIITMLYRRQNSKCLHKK